jgi:hypothetical protein
MILPNAAQVVIEPRKLLDYVLNLAHPVGGHHAVLFRDLLGITVANWTILRDAILQAAQSEQVIPGQSSAYGQKYELRFTMAGPGGAKIVLVVWLIEHSDPRPRLITCYVE